MPKPPYNISPQIGYGPIKFGMTLGEVRAILGPPYKTSEGRIGDGSDEERVRFNKGRVHEWYGEKYPDPTNPQVTYDDGKVVSVTIFRQSGSLIYKGMDLHKIKRREDVLEALAQDEDTYLLQ